MGLVSFITGFVAPIFIIISPITSYADQTYSIHRTKSSAGFSLDIPLIMLVASMLKIFYYPGARFDTALLIQAFIMIAIQLVLLKVALDHRPSPSSKGGDAAVPFSGAREREFEIPRPYNFWQWRSHKPYWQFLLYLFISLVALELLMSPIPTLYSLYSASLGAIGLSIEATLPLPQILSNYKSRSCKGFRVSVIANWIAGDIMKMFWFFTATSEIPWTFKLCGIFQMCCDLFLGGQYFVYGDGEAGKVVKEHAQGLGDGDEVERTCKRDTGKDAGRREGYLSWGLSRLGMHFFDQMHCVHCVKRKLLPGLPCYCRCCRCCPQAC